MLKSYKYDCPRIDLADHKVNFARCYAESGDSLEAYLETHTNFTKQSGKKITKVKASTVLQSPMVWYKIISCIREKKVNSLYESKVLEAYDLAIQEIGLSPIRIFLTYSAMVSVEDEQIENNIQVKSDDADPLKVINKICYSYNFFNILRRKYFLTKLARAIQREINYMQLLAKKNKDWYHDYNTLNNKVVDKFGFNLNNIIE